jgi:hypothetical protein
VAVAVVEATAMAAMTSGMAAVTAVTHRLDSREARRDE